MRSLFVLLLAVPLLLTAACAQTPAETPPHDTILAEPGTPTPNWTALTDATERVQADTSRLVLVHAYAVWCRWCRRMDQEVYADSTIRAYLDAHYEPVRLDIESDKAITFMGDEMTEAEFASFLGVSGVPAAAFLTPQGELLTMLPGFSPPDRFLNVLRFLAERIYERESFADYIDRVEAPVSLEETPSTPPTGG